MNWDGSISHPIDKTGWPWTDATPPLPPTMPDGSPWPKISIVTPSFNQAQYIEETIRSVLLQGYPNLEYLIIDGGSTDGSVEIIKKYSPWLTYWVSEPDRGQSHAINKGIDKASGDWIAWLNSDDIYLPDTFSKIAATISRSAKTTSWIVGTTVITDQYLHKTALFKPNMYTVSKKHKNYISMGWVDFICSGYSRVSIPQPSSFWLRSAVIKAGKIDESLYYIMDYELYIRLAYEGFLPYLINEELAFFRSHQEQKTSNYPLPCWLEQLKVIYSWADRVDGYQKKTLESYGKWLENQIKYYPYQVFYESVKSTIKKPLKFMFGSIYKQVNIRVNRDAPQP